MIELYEAYADYQGYYEINRKFDCSYRARSIRYNNSYNMVNMKLILAPEWKRLHMVDAIKEYYWC